MHVDFAGLFCGTMWLTVVEVVDAHSKWPEVFEMSAMHHHCKSCGDIETFVCPILNS